MEISIYKFKRIIIRVITIPLILFTFSPHNLHSQENIQTLRPYPNNGQQIGTFKFTGKDTGYISVNSHDYYQTTFNGCMYKTTNAGLNWFLLTSTTSSSPFYYGPIYFINTNTGFASMGTLRKTINGGLNWAYCYVSFSLSRETITFINDTLGYAVTGSEYGPQFYKTTNAGEYWSQKSTGVPGWYRSIYDLKYFDANTGLFCGEMLYLYRTTNGGLNWTSVYPQDYAIFTSISIADDSTVYVSGNFGRFLKSTNRGIDWITSNLGYTWIEKIHFLNVNTGYAGFDPYIAGAAATIKKTTDGGLTWFGFYDTVNYSFPDGLFQFFNVNEGYACQSFGDILKTTNGGLNFYKDYELDDFNTIFMLNDNTGFAGGKNGVLFKSTNSSANWSVVRWLIFKNIGNRLNDIYFKNYKNGIIVSDSGKIFVTNDSANSFQVIQTAVNDKLNKIYFISENTGYIIGNKGALLKTTNSGNNWSRINIGTTKNINGIYKTSDVFYICGDSGLLMKSTDSGNNWFQFNSPITGRINSLAFKNNNYGFIVGDSAKCLKTLNGGLNWTLIDYLNTTHNLNIIEWFKDSSICIVGDHQVIRISNDNGISWGIPATNYGIAGTSFIGGGHYHDTHFLNNNLGFFCGSYGLIQRTTNGGGTIVNYEKKQTIFPQDFMLKNYPNPFNPVTKISFVLPKESKVKLIIYDMLGREVAKIINNENLSAGTYIREFNGSNLASGVYFLRILVNDGKDFTDVKKIVLLK